MASRFSEPLSSGLSSDHGGKSEDEQLSNPHDFTPRSTARRTTRNRAARPAPAGISDSDFSEDDEDSPRRMRVAGGRTSKKSGKSTVVLRDDSGRPLSPAEARRQRKRITNRESARRMRLLRKEEWNNLQQEVHDKTIELQKVHTMNRHLNEGYSQLEAKVRSLQAHNHALVNEVLSLVEHLRENLGKEIDNKRLAVFLRNMSQLLPQQPSVHPAQRPAQPTNLAAGHTPAPWVPDFKDMAYVERFPSHINLTAHGEDKFNMDSAGAKRASPIAEQDLQMSYGVGGQRQPKRQRTARASSDSPPSSSLSPQKHPVTPNAITSPSQEFERGPMAPSVQMPPPAPMPPMSSSAPGSATLASHPALAPMPALPPMSSLAPSGAIAPSSTMPPLPDRDHLLPVVEVDTRTNDAAPSGPNFPGPLVPAIGGSLDIDFTALGRFPSVDAQFCAEINANGGLDPQLSISKLLAFDYD